MAGANTDPQATVNNFERLDVFVKSIPEQVAGIIATAQAFEDEFFGVGLAAVETLRNLRGHAWAPGVEFPTFPTEGLPIPTNWAKTVLEDAVSGKSEAEEIRTDKLEDEVAPHKELVRLYGRKDFLADYAYDMSALMDLMADAGYPMQCLLNVSGDTVIVEAYRETDPPIDFSNVPDPFQVELYEVPPDDNEFDEDFSTYQVRVGDRFIIDEGCDRDTLIRLRVLLTPDTDQTAE